jgi:ribonuclease P protein component
MPCTPLEPGPMNSSDEASEARFPDRGLSRSQRLTRSSLFQETYAQGRRWVGRYMVLWIRDGENACLRLGVVASKKVGKSPQRSRAKRRLREVFRNHRHTFSGDLDVVLVARHAILKAEWPALVEEFLGLAQKAGICRGEQDS